ncbi:MAG: ribosome biogenesis GTPase Der [Gammaproteobacteria bacterium]
MLPVLALVGRPNVGKSTLFNHLTASRNALVADVPGLTRDRHYGYATIDERRVLVVDTGGLAGESELAAAAETQTWRAVDEADRVLLLVDARSGLVPADTELAGRLRAMGKLVYLIANKAEGLPPGELAEFHALGFPAVYPVSAKRGSGIAALTSALAEGLPTETPTDEEAEQGLAVSIIGRPNVGKSTLVNRLLGEERLLATDIPGTTRDAIRVPLERKGKHYLLIDTAGFRRRSHVEAGGERLGVLAGIRALEEASVAVVMTDAREGVTGQDQRLVRLALERGRAVVIALNKWDGIEAEARHHALASSERRFTFAPFVRQIQLSALQGTGIGRLLEAVDEAGRAVAAEFATPDLNRVLQRLVAETQPPLVRGRRIKLRYAHQSGKRPPRIRIHGTQAERLPAAYRRYLAAGFREAFALAGVPLALEFKSPANPYADKPRTPRSRRR